MSGCRQLSDEEYTKTKEKLQHSLRNKCIFILGYRAGFRISELLSIKIKDVWQCNEVTDSIKVQKRNIKGKSQSREVVLHKEAKLIIKEYILSLRSIDLESPLFKSRQGINKPLDRRMAWRLLRDAFKAAHVTGSVATHSMRKSFAFKIYKKLGNDMYKTKNALGHSSVLTTEKYIPIDFDEISLAIKSMD